MSITFLLIFQQPSVEAAVQIKVYPISVCVIMDCTGVQQNSFEITEPFNRYNLLRYIL